MKIFKSAICVELESQKFCDLSDNFYMWLLMLQPISFLNGFTEFKLQF